MEARADAPEESDAVGSPLDPSTRELGGDNKLRSTGAAVPQRATNKTTKEEDPGGQYINVKLVVLPSTSKAHDAKVLVQFSIAQLASKVSVCALQLLAVMQSASPGLQSGTISFCNADALDSHFVCYNIYVHFASQLKW